MGLLDTIQGQRASTSIQWIVVVTKDKKQVIKRQRCLKPTGLTDAKESQVFCRA